MLREHEQTLIESVSGDERQDLRLGDGRVVVHVHSDGEAYVVGFLTLDGDTATIATVLPSRARAFTSADLTYARFMEISA